MGLIARTPICGDCMASFGRDREGPCEAPGCSGHVSWEAAFDALATTHRGAVATLTSVRVWAEIVRDHNSDEHVRRHMRMLLGLLDGEDPDVFGGQ
jgi:hypothetical protein